MTPPDLITNLAAPEMRAYAAGLTHAARTLDALRPHFDPATWLPLAVQHAAWLREADVLWLVARRLEDDGAAEQRAEGLADAVADALASPKPHDITEGAREIAAALAEAFTPPPPPKGKRGDNAAQAGARGWTPERRARQAALMSQMRAAQLGGGEWTEARLETLRAEYARAPLTDLLAAVNALPGCPIASIESLRVKAKRLGLRRATEPAAPDAAQPEPEADEPPPAPPAVESPAPPKHAQPRSANGHRGTVWTAERQAVMRRRWPAGDDAAAILAEVNALPGEPCLSLGALQAQAKILDLRRPTQRRVLDRDAPAISYGDEEPDALTTEDLHEARSMLDQGAKALAEHFGGGLGWWQGWCARERQKVPA